MPMLVHGGPGLAGRGEELAGVCRITRFMQGTAAQASPAMPGARGSEADRRRPSGDQRGEGSAGRSDHAGEAGAGGQLIMFVEHLDREGGERELRTERRADRRHMALRGGKVVAGV